MSGAPSWERSVEELLVVLEQDNWHLTDDDCQQSARLIREGEQARAVLEKLVQGCQYARTSERDGGVEFHYEGATSLTEEQMGLVNELKGLDT